MSRVKVLLVDDETELLQALSERLQLRGFEVLVAASGERALGALEVGPVDLMVLDLKMPGMDGMEVLRRTRRSHPEVQVIMLTGHGSEKDRDEALRLGVFDYLQKPVDIVELVDALQRASARL
ncbi:MAG: response regulator [Syntrophobacteraceae bacterium]|jgi:DNA-binding response OmpR family regulator|nr:response regulator [Syntrophobacteraceae bacterium]